MSGKGQSARRILVSGRTSGIGRACTERFSAAGDRVWVLGQSEATVARVRTELGLAGGTACDVSQADAVDAAVGQAAGELQALELPELAALVDFLLNRDAAYLTGSVISVDGGTSI